MVLFLQTPWWLCWSTKKIVLFCYLVWSFSHQIDGFPILALATESYLKSNLLWALVKWPYNYCIWGIDSYIEEKVSLKIKCRLCVYWIWQHLLTPLPIKALKFTKDNQWINFRNNLHQGYYSVQRSFIPNNKIYNQSIEGPEKNPWKGPWTRYLGPQDYEETSWQYLSALVVIFTEHIVFPERTWQDLRYCSYVPVAYKLIHLMTCHKHTLGITSYNFHLWNLHPVFFFPPLIFLT